MSQQFNEVAVNSNLKRFCLLHFLSREDPRYFCLVSNKMPRKQHSVERKPFLTVGFLPGKLKSLPEQRVISFDEGYMIYQQSLTAVACIRVRRHTHIHTRTRMYV